MAFPFPINCKSIKGDSLGYKNIYRYIQIYNYHVINYNK